MGSRTTLVIMMVVMVFTGSLNTIFTKVMVVTNMMTVTIAPDVGHGDEQELCGGH